MVLMREQYWSEGKGENRMGWVVQEVMHGRSKLECVI